MPSHEITIGPHATTQLPISTSKKIVDIAGDTKPIIEEVQPRRSKKSPLSSSTVWVTHSRRNKKSRELVVNQIVVDLDLGKETEVTMDQ